MIFCLSAYKEMLVVGNGPGSGNGPCCHWGALRSPDSCINSRLADTFDISLLAFAHQLNRRHISTTCKHAHTDNAYGTVCTVGIVAHWRRSKFGSLQQPN
jgi:hypothetical protein